MKKSKTLALGCAVLALCAAAALLITLVLVPGSRYRKAERLLELEQYEKAIDIFVDLGDYRDTAARAADARQTRENGDLYSQALTQLEEESLTEIIVQAVSMMEHPYQTDEECLAFLKTVLQEELKSLNLDGGSSTVMYLNGELVNSPSSESGLSRGLPNAFLFR